MGIKHSFTSPATPDPGAGSSIVGPNEWNDHHVILGSADNAPASPSIYDDEFETTSFAGWTTLGSPNAHSINVTIPGHYYVKTTTVVAGWVGIYKAISFTSPKTLIVKVSDYTSYFNNNKSGIILLPSNLSAAEAIYLGQGDAWSFRGESFTSLNSSGTQLFNSSMYYHPPFYIKIVFNSATSYSVYGSSSGMTWTPYLTNRTCSFTIANVGLAVRDESIINPVEASFDFFRVT